MTRELIFENCLRLSTFYKNDINPNGLKSEISVVDESFKSLLKVYGRILDYNGAPARNLSRLYINDEAFDKMLNELYEIGVAIDYLYMNHSCSFSYVGYYWEVINEDAIKAATEDIINKTTNQQLNK